MASTEQVCFLFGGNYSLVDEWAATRQYKQSDCSSSLFQLFCMRDKGLFYFILYCLYLRSERLGKQLEKELDILAGKEPFRGLAKVMTHDILMMHKLKLEFGFAEKYILTTLCHLFRLVYIKLSTSMSLL